MIPFSVLDLSPIVQGGDAAQALRNTQDLARHAGVKLTAKQAAKYVPIAGQIVSAALGYAALRALGEQHIKDCVRVSATLSLPPPGPHAPA